MSVVFEPRDYLNSGSYPPIDDHPTSDPDRFSDPDPVTGLAEAFAAPPQYVDGTVDLGGPPMSKESSPIATTPSRLKAIPKPDREVTKNLDGKYVCSFADCTEEIREFGRKCEWNKHMDKHDRPYKCAAEGCEKLPGFTYSGGLLRHEREVHGKHGGPKNSFNCPHPNCKRNSGKGFSRLENLNEHLRRVHTQNGAVASPGGGGADDAAGSDAAAAAALGQKRKREHDGDDDDSLREENKRLRHENEEMRRQIDGLTLSTNNLLQQLTQLQQQQEQEQQQRLVAPQAQMGPASNI
ncbi:hypothetical protein QBC39DRAFT_254854 [Podospora conica]|nr:hypothetical protein QBC39DRAFT_254854 [Schizothecium conicum]